MENSLFTMENSLFTMENSLLKTGDLDFIGLKYPTNHYNHYNHYKSLENKLFYLKNDLNKNKLAFTMKNSLLKFKNVDFISLKEI